MLVFGIHQTPAIPRDEDSVTAESHAAPARNCDPLVLSATCSNGRVRLGYDIPAVLPSDPTDDIVPVVDGDGDTSGGAGRERGRRQDDTDKPDES